MGLKISLKSGEKMIIGGAVISNGDSKSTFYIENKVTILREKDIMKESEADTPCKKIYFAIQLMYIDGKNIIEYHSAYWNLVKDVLAAAPGTLNLIDQISSHILGGECYKALKITKKLMEYEKGILENARKASV